MTCSQVGGEDGSAVLARARQPAGAAGAGGPGRPPAPPSHQRLHHRLLLLPGPGGKHNFYS
jgi:hypothetical protein